MPEHEVIGGAAAYVDAEGQERWAYRGQVIDFTKDEADRLMEAGMLRDVKAEQARAKAEQDALAAAREAEDQARADEAERVAGEAKAAEQAAAKAQRGPQKNGA
jgi:hypothetical protein